MPDSTFADDSLSRLRLQMAEHRLDACITTYPVHVAYLSGVFPPKDRLVAVLVTPESATLISPHPPADLPQTMSAMTYEDYSIDYVVNPAANFAGAFDRAVLTLAATVRRVGLEPAYLALEQWEAIQRSLNVEHIEDINPVLRQMRMVKTAAELPLIEHAEEITDRMYAAIAGNIVAGASEVDVFLTTLAVVKADPSKPAELDGDYVSGPRTEAIGGPPTTRRLQVGDLLIADLFPRLATHCADCCRTYSVGKPPQALIDRHALLEEALATGEKAIQPGLPTRELYAIVRSVFEREGMAQYFPHHAGHGVGILPSEEPRIIPGSDEILAAGMVITLEPGLYLPGQGGMRLEDNFLVTENGCRCLTHYPRRLTVL